MRTIRNVAELRAALAGPRRAGREIGLVPTMGAFHEGHLSLMRRARQDCDEVVVSLFVNPTQFNDGADLAGYPRDEQRDQRMAAEVGVDYLFAPPLEEVYPAGFATTVSISAITETLEGAHRGRAHFDGVTTVVTKLFNMVGADVAYFGQKDAQQVAVIRALVRDLDIPIRIEVCPTVRDVDGVALSSRNVHLTAAQRGRATALSRALRAAQAAVAAGERDGAVVREIAHAELQSAELEPEYLELVCADTFAPCERIDRRALLVVAARVGEVRLIDNQPLSLLETPASGGSRSSTPLQVQAMGRN
ncbi:MAG: pantoate--beta-alanine ligase [Solirubrobacterales bacterium]|nr:pantoate--beta-alanine ligase [Solirubrobacterales bacterium]